MDNQSYNDNEDSLGREINTQKLDDLLNNRITCRYIP